MTKLAKPLLSLDAHGSIGNAITFLRRPGSTIAMKKPVPFDRQTLLQQYQRWLYQDAGWYWQALTMNQKAHYRADGARSHMSAYPAFLRYYLRNQPDELRATSSSNHTGISNTISTFFLSAA
ncbi:hypothetical protein ES703_124093 [subsurface metagenome]